MVVFALALALITPTGRPLVAPHDTTLRVVVDSSAHTVTLLSGPHQVPGMADHEMASMAGPMQHHGSLEPFRRFLWPVDGWIRGVSLSITDRNGHEVPRRLIHHLNVVNLDRRQLFYPIPERIIALGQETEDIDLPASIGVPVEAGDEMGLVVMWHNMSGVDYTDLTVRLTIAWSPTNLYPRPLSVMPVYMDVVNPVGRKSADFDLPAGRNEFHAEFTMPFEGRIIGVGGHLHDYGTGLTLTDVSGDRSRRVVTLGTTLDASGRIDDVERQYPGVRGAGIKLEAGHRYRLVATYDNPGAAIPDGAMAHMVLLFAPKDPAKWPKVDPGDPGWKGDIADLEADGQPAAGMDHAHQH